MFEKPPGEPEIKKEEDIEENIEWGPAYDHEAEKEHRKGIKKLLYKELNGVLKKNGMKKIGSSVWETKIEDSLQLLYLQRSYLNNKYLVNVGIGSEKEVPEGEKPDFIFYKKDCPRIEQIIREIEEERMPESENKEQEIKEKIEKVVAALDFEIPGGLEKYPGDPYHPSVSMEEAKEKIDTIRNAVDEYVPLWFKKHSKPE